MRKERGVGSIGRRGKIRGRETEQMEKERGRGRKEEEITKEKEKRGIE